MLDMENMKELFSDIQSGGGKLGEITKQFPDAMKGNMAKQFWIDPKFTYGVEYGALIVLNHLMEAEEP